MRYIVDNDIKAYVALTKSMHFPYEKDKGIVKQGDVICRDVLYPICYSAGIQCGRDFMSTVSYYPFIGNESLIDIYEAIVPKGANVSEHVRDKIIASDKIIIGNRVDTKDVIYGLKSATRLVISDIRSGTIPDYIFELEMLASITFLGCDSIISIGPEISKLNRLQRLFVNGAKALRNIDEAIWSVKSLSSLEIGDCEVLPYLPDGVRRSTSLSSIDIWDCQMMCRLPRDIFDADKLCFISVANCPKLGATDKWTINYIAKGSKWGPMNIS